MRLWNRIVGGGDEAVARARRPQELAASMEQPPLQGIDWLGRTPGPEAPLLYRLLIAIAAWFLFGLCRLRLSVTGAERMPSEGCIAVSALHRSWIDPLLVVRALPLEPRVWFMGSGATAFDRTWKERLLQRTGGLLPVWRGGTDVSVHVRTAQAVVDAGGVLGLFAEGRIGGAPNRPARMRSGAALLCLRTGAPIVPIAVSGAEELYRGKRLRVDVLGPFTAAELLGVTRLEPVEAGSRAELRQARELTAALEAKLAASISASYPVTVDPPGARRRWRWLTRLLR